MPPDEELLPRLAALTGGKACQNRQGPPRRVVGNNRLGGACLAAPGPADIRDGRDGRHHATFSSEAAFERGTTAVLSSYPRGRSRRRSRTVATPRRSRRAAAAGPTPRSEETSRVSSQRNTAVPCVPAAPALRTAGGRVRRRSAARGTHPEARRRTGGQW